MIILSILYIIGVFQGVLLSIVLFTSRKGNHTSNKFLALFLILASIILATFVLEYNNFYEIYPRLYFLKAHIFFLLGPVFYFYVKSLTSLSFKFSYKVLFHLLPFIAFFLIIFPFYLQDHESMMLVVKTPENLQNREVSFSDLILQVILKGYYLAYLIFSLLYLNSTQNNSTSTNIKKYKWLKKLIIVILFTASLSIIIDFFPKSISRDVYTPFITTVVLLFMGYLGLRQSEIFSEMEIKKKNKKYNKSTLTEEKAEGIYLNILHIMGTEKYFSDSNISLPKLAKKMDISSHHLSQVINEKFNQNFFNFINMYRIEEAKKLLAESGTNKLNITQIAYGVGFNSTSAFNSAFKKLTGSNPQKYKNQINKIN